MEAEAIVSRSSGGITKVAMQEYTGKSKELNIYKSELGTVF